MPAQQGTSYEVSNIIRPADKGLRFFIFNYLAKSMKYFTLKFNTAMILL